jgi:hypothetical protein
LKLLWIRYVIICEFMKPFYALVILNQGLKAEP